jgi:hypothetical protein
MVHVIDCTALQWSLWSNVWKSDALNLSDYITCISWGLSPLIANFQFQCVQLSQRTSCSDICNHVYYTWSQFYSLYYQILCSECWVYESQGYLYNQVKFCTYDVVSTVDRDLYILNKWSLIILTIACLLCTVLFMCYTGFIRIGVCKQLEISVIRNFSIFLKCLSLFITPDISR